MRPISFGVKVTQPQFFDKPVLDSCDMICDFAGYEFQTASRALMIEDDTATSEHVVALTIVDRDPMSVHFRNAVRTTGMERGLLGLGHLFDQTKEFAGGGLVKPNALVNRTTSFKNPSDTKASNITG